MCAAKHNHGEVAKLLLNKGADINAQDEGGGTALMVATQPGYLNEVKILLEKGADVNAKDVNGTTALGQMYLPHVNYKEIEKLLKAHGAKE